MSRVKNTKAPRPKHSSYEVRTTQSLVFEISWANSKFAPHPFNVHRSTYLSQTDANTSHCHRFDSIDPTPSHASAHPQSHGDTIAFSIKDTPSEDPSMVTVSEITTRHLRRLKSSASDYLGKPVTAAVIAIPTDFAQTQKDALTEAAKAAGLEVLQFISEPSAALLASDRRSASGNKPADKITVLADLGGTRSDISVVSVRGGMYSILATTHDYTLGGSTLDATLIDYFAKEFLKKHSSSSPEDPRQNPRSAAKLRLEAEATKKSLSLGASASVHIESLSSGLDFSLTVNRTRYELLASKSLARFTRLILDAVAKADLDVLDIDEVILAGGTAHTPRIASNTASAFPASTSVIAPSTTTGAVNPSELTARGAALQAYMIEGFEPEDVEQSTHPALTVTPHLAQTVGIVVVGDDSSSGSNDDETFLPIVAAETPLPVRRTLTFLNKADTTSGILIRLCEGTSSIKITKPEPKPKTNGSSQKPSASDSDPDSDSDDDDDEEEEDQRSKEWKIGASLGELALRDVTRGKKVTCQVSIAADLGVSVSASEVGAGKTGVGGMIEGVGGGQAMNGAAH